MIKTIEAYQLYCDNCNKLFETVDYGIWSSIGDMEDSAENEGWNISDKTLCECCYESLKFVRTPDVSPLNSFRLLKDTAWRAQSHYHKKWLAYQYQLLEERRNAKVKYFDPCPIEVRIFNNIQLIELRIN